MVVVMVVVVVVTALMDVEIHRSGRL